MTDIDQLMRESLRRLAVPGDSTGVAEAILARVDGGDTGTPSDTGSGFTGNGLGGLGGSSGTWMLWVGTGIIAGLAGGLLGATGAFDTSASADTPTILYSVSTTTAGLDCPSGVRVASFHPGDRVLAVARSDDSAWLAVRSPYDRADTVWVAASELALDGGEPAVGTLTIDGCPTAVATPLSDPDLEAEQPPADPPLQPQPPQPQPPKPQPAPDTIPPIVTQLTRTPNGMFMCSDANTTNVLRITAAATDDTSVAGVRISFSGQHTAGPFFMTPSGGTWTYDYVAPASEVGSGGDVVVTVRAVDPAGSLSQPRSITVNVQCLH